MKNVKKAIALVAVIMGISTASFAQDGLSVRAGGNFPVGTFAQGKATDLALSSLKSELGGAATGFNVGLRYQLGILGDISAFASADLFYNGLKSEIKDDLKGDNENVTLPSYMNIPVMVGANYTILDIIGTTLWAEAGIGVNFRNITSSTFAAAVGSLVSGSTESDYNLSTSFAWQVGVGVSVSSKVSLGLHYYGFGAADVRGEQTASGNLGGLISGETKPVDFTLGKLNPSMVVIRLGYHF